MNTTAYFSSVSQELRSLKDRVRQMGDDTHWLTDGEWKESVLRSVLRRHLPRSIEIGRGFVVTAEKMSSQIDILLYSTESPVLFRDGDLVFVTPDAVRGIIEVKSSVDRARLKEAAGKIAVISDLLIAAGFRQTPCGIFSYDASLTADSAMSALKEACSSDAYRVVELACLGSSHFIKWWSMDPIGHRTPVTKWHSYRSQELAPGYFIHNFIERLCPRSVSMNSALWFPIEGKESHKDGEMELD